MDETTIKLITQKVLEAMDSAPVGRTEVSQPESREDGIYSTVDEAVQAASRGYITLCGMTIEERGEIIDAIREQLYEQVDALTRLELEESRMGRFEDKALKFRWMLKKVPGIEDIRPEAFSGDMGVTLVERLPFGVAGCIMPSTAAAITIVHNAISMIAAGNTMVVSYHPGCPKSAIKTVELLNKAIASAGGPKGLVVTTDHSNMDLTNELMHHPLVKLLVATGGPGVVKAVLSTGKKAIGAGAGNPPAVVDETANLLNAARSIVSGNYFENGIQCIGEKEVFVVESVADQLIEEMVRYGAYLIRDDATIERLTKLVTTEKGLPNREFVGVDPPVILKALGIDVSADTKSIIYEVPADHITVMEEYLMPLLPIVRVRDVKEGIICAVKAEGGRRHTAVMHSNNIQNMSLFAKAVSTTVFVKNGSSFAGVGLGGEGHITVTIAGPTGEGLTTARTFTRAQRCALTGSFNIRASNELAYLMNLGR